MSKQFVDALIHNMKLAGIVTKAAPWMVEGIHDQQMNVRYVGITCTEDWLDIISEKNNLLLKFVIDRSSANLEFYIANKPPFFRFTSRQFSENDKWETLLGEVKRKLKRDKQEVMNHTEVVGNLYARIQPHLK